MPYFTVWEPQTARRAAARRNTIIAAVAKARQWVAHSTLRGWQRRQWFEALARVTIFYGGSSPGIEGEYHRRTAEVFIYDDAFSNVERVVAVIVHEVAHAAGLSEIEAEIVEEIVAGAYATPITCAEYGEGIEALVETKGGLRSGRWFVIDERQDTVHHVTGEVAIPSWTVAC